MRTVGYSYAAVSDLSLTETRNIERIFLYLRICVLILLCNICDFGLLRTHGFFVNLDFLLVILDIFRVMHET